METKELMGYINGWSIFRLPKNLDHKYILINAGENEVFNSLKEVFNFTSK